MLSNDQVDEVERRLLAGETFRSVAAALAIGLSTVTRIAAGGRRRRAAYGQARKRAAEQSPYKHAAATALCSACGGPLVAGEPCLLCKVRQRQAA